MQLQRTVVVGGVNMDIGGRAFAPLVARDSNPGTVRMSMGGVGRNIAHNMTLLGLNVTLLTALGDDLSAQRIVAGCTALGMDLHAALRVPDGATSTYLFLSGPDGDMALALSDMEIVTHVTPAYLQTCREVLEGAQLVVADTNIPAESLLWLAENVTAPLFSDPVSTAKAVKLKPILGRLHTLKPNRIEAELLSGVPITDEESLARAARTLLGTGLQRVFISLGGDGVYAADHTKGIHLPCLPARMTNTTGCGDAFMAALAWAYTEGLGLEQSAEAGLAASAIAMEGEETINPALSPDGVRGRMGTGIPQITIKN